jgi:hypothetical protein
MAWAGRRRHMSNEVFLILWGEVLMDGYEAAMGATEQAPPVDLQII